MIYFGGDSYTEGCELKNPKEDCFASLIGKNYNIPIINDALSGSSNHRIVRKFFENISSNIKLVIISWTFADRFEHYLPRINVGSNQDGWRIITPRMLWDKELYNPYFHNTPKINKALGNYMVKVRTHTHAAERFFNQIIQIQKTCSLARIPVIMSIVHPMRRLLEYELDFFKSSYSYPKVNWDNSIWLNNKNWDMYSYCEKNNLPIGPQGHFLEAGHRAVANLFINKIDQDSLLK